MNIKKLLTIAASVLLITQIFTSSVIALDISESEAEAAQRVVSNNIDLTQYSELVILEPIKVQGEVIHMYVEFQDVEKAIMVFCSRYREIFDSLRFIYNLDSVNGDNALQYFEKFLESLDADNDQLADSYTVAEFRRFFDFVEASQSNREIIELVEELNRIKLHTSTPTTQENFNDMMFQLVMLVPTYNTVYLQENEKIINASKQSTKNNSDDPNSVIPFGLSGSALTNATNYAAKWATVENSDTYGRLSADCTNFASQILFAAGVSQNVTSNENTGWWHKKVKHNSSYPPGYYYSHQYSISWIRADTFIRYMGTGARAYNIKSLSELVQPGSFIGADWSGNGSWDHVAFVTATTNYYGTYTNGVGQSFYYKNFRVAQHTNNYHDWVASINNNWETFATGEIAVIVRP